MGGGLGRVTKHPDYYLDDGSVSFLINNILFRVHQSFFTRESEVFRDLFAHAAEEDPQSGTDALPFTPKDVAPEEFAQLLWVWYDREYSYRQQTKENWVTVLRLSTRWEFKKIKELAIRELDALRLSPAERISIYNEYGVDDDRLLDSYVELCKSPTLPTESEARLMQMETLINVLQAREDAQRRAVELGHESPTSASLGDDTLREIVSRFFRIGLNLQSNGTSTGSGVQASGLNDAHSQGTGAGETIRLGEPQVPDRTARSTRELPSRPNDSVQTDSEGKGSQDKNKGESNETCRKMEQEQATEEDKRKLAQATQDKQKEKLEEVRQAKEKEEQVKAEKARLAKEKEENERMEKAKQDQEKEAKEKGRKQEQQKTPVNNQRKGRGN